uniref:GHMP kinase N-terminal domain-containing protein n=1 Tax=Pseudo-nitzschia australis TaxID=44445 RepID=A0A7S4ELZ7_9STRA|mmetsp:Transcript_8032/g.17294  ORF Transcript_8032/g.17294 Transcript_8032/m.17294 type:complete len:494 (+) Transcript_8032:186-1667(+)
METTFTAIAPGRLCLFGEHQDYLGLPVIALALPLLCCKIDVVVTVTDDDNNTRDSADDTIIIHLHLPEVLGGETREYYLDDLPPSPPRTQEEGEDYDFALAAIHEVLKEEELKGLNGIDKISVRGEEKRKQKVYVRCKSFIGDLPLRAGCSSSTAFVTAFVLVLQRIFKDQRNRQLRTSTTPSINSNGDKNDNGCDGNSAGDRDGDGDGDGDSDSDLLELAKLAYRAEVTHFGNPGGTMDHVAIALGSRIQGKKTSQNSCGALRIGPHPWQVEPLPLLLSSDSDNSKADSDNGVWILAYSGEPKDTMKHLKRCKHDRLELLQQKLNGDWDHPISVGDHDCNDNDGSKSQERPISTSTLSETEYVLRNATITNRDSEEKAAEIWRSYKGLAHQPSTKGESLGRTLAYLMKEHHEALRDGLGLSTPRLEAMNQAALDAGAWGFKVVGSGGGGCGVAWAPFCKATAVATAVKNVGGAEKTWIIKNSGQGAHIISKR